MIVSRRSKLITNTLRAGLTPDDRTPRQVAHTKHGGRYTRLYSIWKNMRRRCDLPTHPDYPRYGGRGITVCPEWSDFSKFREDMGDPPSPLHTLDRKEVNGSYCKSNCRWATSKEQNRNRRDTRVVQYLGRSMSLAEAAELAGVPYKKAHERLQSGMTIERVLSRIDYK